MDNPTLESPPILNLDIRVVEDTDGFEVSVANVRARFPDVSTFEMASDRAALDDLPRSRESVALHEMGVRLFERLFSGALSDLFRDLYECATDARGLLRIRLDLREARTLVVLPWEYMFDPGIDRYLFISSDLSLVRVVARDQSRPLFPVVPPLHVLYGTGNTELPLVRWTPS